MLGNSKKKRLSIVELSHREATQKALRSSITELCMKVRMSRQNYYKERRKRQCKVVDEHLIIKLAEAERRIQPRLGAKKLYGHLLPELKSAGIKIGRCGFETVLYNNGLKLARLPKGPKTTDSSHSLGVFLNLVKGKAFTGPNQAWASDITYIRTGNRFMYLSLITDMYSRFIVGYHFSECMDAVETAKALDMALKKLPTGAKPIHHSDRGSQYCSHEYVKRLKLNNFKISMTETDHCAENAMAERVNGILKQEYFLGGEFKDSKTARKAVRQAIKLYNSRRAHMSLQYQTPQQVHCNEIKLAA